MAGWDLFIQQHAADGGLLQSEGWEHFQRALGRRVEEIVIPATPTIVGGDRNPSDSGQSQNDGFSMAVLVIERPMPLGQSYVYSPRGPVVREQSIDRLIIEIRERFPKAMFWRIEPTTQGFRVQGLGFRVVRSPHDIQPSTTLIIDLSKSEEELLADMKQKTRYNIKIAQRHGVAVRGKQEAGSRKQFLDLMEETARRDGFRAHPREYYRQLLQGARSKEQGAATFELFGAFYNDQLLAGVIVAFFGNRAYYLHGASSSEHRELMAPYLLHWEVVREAKRKGCITYDLWGVAPHLTSPLRGEEWVRGIHPWVGITRFKTGFAPTTPFTHYPGTFDVVLDPWKYWLYRVARFFATLR